MVGKSGRSCCILILPRSEAVSIPEVRHSERSQPAARLPLIHVRAERQLQRPTPLVPKRRYKTSKSASGVAYGTPRPFTLLLKWTKLDGNGDHRVGRVSRSANRRHIAQECCATAAV